MILAWMLRRYRRLDRLNYHIWCFYRDNEGTPEGEAAYNLHNKIHKKIVQHVGLMDWLGIAEEITR